MIFDEHLRFSGNHSRVVANFVQSIDGKTAVQGSGGRAYWPLGSERDYDLLTELRARADVLIHGSRTALFCRTLDRIGAEAFQNRRAVLGKTKPLIYCVLSTHPTPKLRGLLADPPKGTEVMLSSSASPTTLIAELQSRHSARLILLEGGPTSLGSFLSERAVDELFLTIAPKIIGSKPETTLTLTENFLFPPSEIQHCTIKSLLVLDNEIFIRYALCS